MLAPDPALLQMRYDAARDAQERAYARGDGAAAALAYRDVRWAERQDFRPAGWNGARDVPPAPRFTAARAPRTRDARAAARLAAIARSSGSTVALWYHDVRTGAWAGANQAVTMPAASLVKLGVLAAGLRASARPERSELWYDLRQLAGWSSNLASNRIVAKVGGEPAVRRALHDLGARASTFPGPYRAGTAVGIAGYTRVTTARDLGRMLYTLHAAAAGNRHAARTARLPRAKARLAVALLADAHPAGDSAGLLRPYVRAATPVARKEGWISDFRGTAAVVYGPAPKIVVVLVHAPRLTVARARGVARRVLAVTLAR